MFFKFYFQVLLRSQLPEYPQQPDPQPHTAPRGSSSLQGGAGWMLCFGVLSRGCTPPPPPSPFSQLSVLGETSQPCDRVLGTAGDLPVPAGLPAVPWGAGVALFPPCKSRLCLPQQLHVQGLGGEQSEGQRPRGERPDGQRARRAAGPVLRHGCQRRAEHQRPLHGVPGPRAR